MMPHSETQLSAQSAPESDRLQILYLSARKPKMYPSWLAVMLGEPSP